MAKVIIFDLDGVLVDTKLIHFEALNESLKKNNFDKITYDDHIKIFDGLPTVEKLKILISKKKISKKFVQIIKKEKAKITSKLLKKQIKKNLQIISLFKKLKKKYKLVIASNAIRPTVNLCIQNLGIKNYVDFSLSNEDIINNKPHPEIYLKIFIKFGIYPNEALIIEDSPYGREAATSSGAKVMPIKYIKEVHLKNIENFLKPEINSINAVSTAWEDDKMNILVPMAGAGKRFLDAGYFFPKPLIEIQNKPMIQWVIDSLNIKGRYIFIIQKEHQEKYNIKSVLNILQPNCKIIELDHMTEGAACTTLLAREYINNNNPLIIANSDQYIKWNSAKTIYDCLSKKVDGGILTFESIHPKWSYAKCDKDNYVAEVAEKKVISKNATVGIYYWGKGSNYVKFSEKMIKKNIRVNNEFYVCPVYNQAIEAKKKIKIYNIDEMWGLGTPEDLNNFNRNYLGKIV